MIRSSRDPEAGALCIRFDEAKIVESDEVSDGIILEFDANGRVVGLEMLYVQERLSNTDLSHVEVEPT